MSQFDLSNPDDAVRLRDLLLPGVVAVEGPSDPRLDGTLRVDERGIRVVIRAINDGKTEVCRELATPAEVADDSFKDHFCPRLLNAFEDAYRILSPQEKASPA